MLNALCIGMRTNETRLNEEAWQRVGGLSNPSKMPCHGYSIPASTCKLGAMLAQVKGTTCSGCYALKGMYRLKTVKAALQKRFDSLGSDTWIADMIRVIAWKEKSGYFRWHDSGDLQSIEHLQKITAVCEALPSIKFWLPTREAGIVKAFLAAGGVIPSNLTIRISATRVDSPAANIAGLTTSGVSSDESKATCIAPKQNNECRDCRACWSKDVLHVNYKKH